MKTDWNAETYHRVSEPQFEWGLRVLNRLALHGDERVLDVGCGTGRLTRQLRERVPDGRVVGVDRSAAMLVQAASHLAGAGVPLVRADAAALPFVDGFDVIFSTATFHWVLDHEKLFGSLFTTLRPGGFLHAQCGGGPNLARLRTRAARLIRLGPFQEHFAGWREPWQYTDAPSAEKRLRQAGFREGLASLEAAPVRFPSAEEFREFVDNVCLHPYLNRLPRDLRGRFSDLLVEAAAADDPKFQLDYWRLNLTGRKPEQPR
jgi:trans-aconitate methyltransferase